MFPSRIASRKLFPDINQKQTLTQIESILIYHVSHHSSAPKPLELRLGHLHIEASRGPTKLCTGL